MKENIKKFGLGLIIILILNLTMGILAWWTGTERSLINIDYFLPLVLLGFRQKILFILAFIIVYFFDFLMIFSQIFPFIRMEDIFYLLKFSLISSKVYIYYAFLLIVLFILNSFILIKIYKPELKISLFFVFNILILTYAYQENFGNYPSKGFWKPNGDRFVYSQLIQYKEYMNKSFIETYELKGDAFQKVKVSSASQSLYRDIENKKVLLIVNESWGVPNNPAINKAVMKDLINNKNVINFKESYLDFKGYTLSGELRELCQKVPSHFNLKDQKTGFENCLPNIYKKKGYETVAVHGALGIMYDRKFWYPRAGFNTLLFRDEGLNLHESFCYSFPGNCDSDIALKVEEQFNKNDSLFLYWLTLNTHSIFDLRDLKQDYLSCEDINVDIKSAACRNLKLQAQFFNTLSNLVNSESMKGTKVIVVGDHEPPIIENENETFIESQVPVIEFEVN